MAGGPEKGRTGMNILGFMENLSVRKRLIYSFIFISLVPVSIVGYISYRSSRTAITRKITQSSLDELNQTVAHVRLKLQEFETVSLQLFIDQQFTEAVSLYNRADASGLQARSKAVTGFFNNYLISNQDIFGFIFISEAADRDPLIVVKDFAAELAGVCAELRTTKDYRNLLQAGGGMSWALLKVDRSHFLYLGRCINEQGTGKTLGVLIILVEEEKIDRIINYHHYSLLDFSLDDRNKYSVIIDSDGNIVSAPQKDLIGRNITAVLSNIEPLKPIMAGTVSDRDYGSEQNQGSYIGEVEEEETLVTYKTIGSDTGIGGRSGWHLLCFTRTSYLYAESTTVGLITMLVAAFFGATAVFISLRVAFGISGPLNSVMEAMEKAENGDLSVRVKLKTRDELGVLGRSFNRMAEKISALITEIQVAVKSVLEHSSVLQESSGQSARAAGNIAEIMTEISRGTTEQINEAEHSIGLMRNLAAQIEKLTKKADEVEKISDSTRELSFKSQETVRAFLTKTKETEEITNVIINNINELKTSADEIGRITEVITNLTEQSNLLALNAAIEAARAGEMGKGFAVVAEEMNKLARESRDGAKTIYEIVKSINEKILLSTETADRAYKNMAEQTEAVTAAHRSFERIIAAMDETTGRMTDMNEIINEVDRAKEETTKSIEVISSILGETAGSAEEVSAATQEQTAIADQVKIMAAGLRAMAENLVTIIERFQLE